MRNFEEQNQCGQALKESTLSFSTCKLSLHNFLVGSFITSSDMKAVSRKAFWADTRLELQAKRAQQQLGEGEPPGGVEGFLSESHFTGQKAE